MTKLLSLALLAAAGYAQDVVNPTRLTIGLGTAAPRGDSYMDPGTAVEVNFGYRYTRYIQADVGVEASFNKDYRAYNSKFNTGLTTATNLFVPVGARIIVPVFNGRIEPSFGVGGVYAYDKGRSYNQHQCGVYGLAGVSYALDSQQRHRVGLTLRYMNLMSPGRPHPQWLNVFGEYTFSWGE